jgi:hypothetical protein
VKILKFVVAKGQEIFWLKTAKRKMTGRKKNKHHATA